MSFVNKEDRDRDFFNACEEIRKQHKGYLPVADMVKKAIYTEADSFYIIPREMARILYDIEKGIPNKKRGRNERYEEIKRRYRNIRKAHPEYSIGRIARIIADQPAPRFYMSEKRALALYYQIYKTRKNSCHISSYVYF